MSLLSSMPHPPPAPRRERRVPRFQRTTSARWAPLAAGRAPQQRWPSAPPAGYFAKYQFSKIRGVGLLTPLRGAICADRDGAQPQAHKPAPRYEIRAGGAPAPARLAGDFKWRCHAK